MNELLEMLEMKEKLDTLIEEVVGDLTVGEAQHLMESGVLTELNIKNAGSALSALSKRIAGSKTAQKAISFGKSTKKATTKFTKNVMGGDKLRQAQLKRKIAKADRAIKKSGEGETRRYASQMTGPELEKYVAQRKLYRNKKNVSDARKTLAKGSAGTAGVAAVGVGASAVKTKRDNAKNNKIPMSKFELAKAKLKARMS